LKIFKTISIGILLANFISFGATGQTIDTSEEGVKSEEGLYTQHINAPDGLGVPPIGVVEVIMPRQSIHLEQGIGELMSKLRSILKGSLPSIFLMLKPSKQFGTALL